MGSIEADVEGLSALSALCQRTAEQLRGDRGALQPGPTFQPTARIVDDVLATAGRAENLISVRLRVTGHTVATAADRLANCDNTSRDNIAGVGQGCTEV